MFAETLRIARADARMSVSRLAELAGTSRSAIADYEAGHKFPRVDTAERIMATLGFEYTTVGFPKPWPGHIDAKILLPLSEWRPDRERAIGKARRDLPTIIEADATAERLDVTWGQVKTLVEGTTVEGDVEAVWRLHELRESALQVLNGVESGSPPRLRVIAEGGLVEANPDLPVPAQAMAFLARATFQGGDPAFIRHLVGGFLTHHGYPWLWVPHTRGPEYRRALVACERNGEAELMVRVLLGSIEMDPDE
ncbi:MAG TPA: helix-turn-helix transcriptional regulator [Leifsonia sp.]|nr:helix-turn-helix transcriptional regulator [Leifsonia sp.]